MKCISLTLLFPLFTSLEVSSQEKLSTLTNLKRTLTKSCVRGRYCWVVNETSDKNYSGGRSTWSTSHYGEHPCTFYWWSSFAKTPIRTNEGTPPWALIWWVAVVSPQTLTLFSFSVAAFLLFRAGSTGKNGQMCHIMPSLRCLLMPLLHRVWVKHNSVLLVPLWPG